MMPSGKKQRLVDVMRDHENGLAGGVADGNDLILQRAAPPKLKGSTFCFPQQHPCTGYAHACDMDAGREATTQGVAAALGGQIPKNPPLLRTRVSGTGAG
jgi:hypothetical protein